MTMERHAADAASVVRMSIACPWASSVARCPPTVSCFCQVSWRTLCTRIVRATQQAARIRLSIVIFFLMLILSTDLAKPLAFSSLRAIPTALVDKRKSLSLCKLGVYTQLRASELPQPCILHVNQPLGGLTGLLAVRLPSRNMRKSPANPLFRFSGPAEPRSGASLAPVSPALDGARSLGRPALRFDGALGSLGAQGTIWLA